MGIKKQMFPWALVKSIKPKVHSQSVLIRGETMVHYEIFMKKKLVDFTWMVMENLDHTHPILLRKKYDRSKRLGKEGLPYVCHLMQLF